MKFEILSLVILCQIGLFQFLAALANKSVLAKELKLVDTEVPMRLKKHARWAPFRRLGLGVILACLTLLPLTGLVNDPTMTKILLVAVTVVSGAAFTIENGIDCKMMRLLFSHTPEGHIRRASLKKREMKQWYHPALEAIPVAVFVATLLFLTRTPEFLAADDSPFNDSRSHLMMLFALQGLLVFGSHYYAWLKGMDVNSMATLMPSLRHRPEVTFPLAEELAGTQVRYFMFARIVISSLLGASIVEKVLKVTGSSLLTIWDITGWVIIGVLLVGVFIYLKKVGGISRKMQKESELNHQ